MSDGNKMGTLLQVIEMCYILPRVVVRLHGHMNLFGTN